MYGMRSPNTCSKCMNIRGGCLKGIKDINKTGCNQQGFRQQPLNPSTLLPSLSSPKSSWHRICVNWDKNEMYDTRGVARINTSHHLPSQIDFPYTRDHLQSPGRQRSVAYGILWYSFKKTRYHARSHELSVKERISLHEHASGHGWALLTPPRSRREGGSALSNGPRCSPPCLNPKLMPQLMLEWCRQKPILESCHHPPHAPSIPSLGHALQKALHSLAPEVQQEEQSNPVVPHLPWLKSDRIPKSKHNFRGLGPIISAGLQHHTLRHLARLC